MVIMDMWRLRDLDIFETDAHSMFKKVADSTTCDPAAPELSWPVPINGIFSIDSCADG